MVSKSMIETVKSLEDTIKNLAKTVKSSQDTIKGLKDELTRFKAVNEIQNLMSKYEYYLTAGRYDEVIEMFALRTKGVCEARLGRGIFEGPEGVRRIEIGVHEHFGIHVPGALIMHPLTTPVIEVAGDGKTAKGVWIGTGITTARRDPIGGDLDKEKGTLQGSWSWNKFGVDFIKEKGKWKIWHLHVYGIFSTSYYKSWVDGDDFESRLKYETLPKELRGDRPDPYYWMYTPNSETELVPKPPEPYESWDDSMSYIK